MCFQAALPFCQHHERQVTIQLHLRRCITGTRKSSALPTRPVPCSLLKAAWLPSRTIPHISYPPAASCRAAAAGPRPGIKKEPDVLRLFISMLCCRGPISAGRASGHPCKCAGPSGGHASCSPPGSHAREPLPYWSAGTSRPLRGRIQAICHDSANPHR